MKAVVYSGYGTADVLKCEDIEKPTPQDGDVLIKVRAAGANPLDWRFLSGRPYIMRLLFGLRRPKGRPGHDVSGVVEAVGKNVARFKPGDEVFGCARGAFAEHACAPERALTMKPSKVTFEEAASVAVAALTALQGLRDKAGLTAGQKVLINGAAGGVGTFAVQIAKALGLHVTAVCSTRNVEMVRSLGADRVIDYTREDFRSGSETYDAILDNVGNCAPSSYRHLLKPEGKCAIAGGPKNLRGILLRVLQARVLSWLGSRKFLFYIAQINAADLALLAELMESGKVKPVVEKVYAIDQVSDAIRYLEQGHARGKLVIRPEAQEAASPMA